MQKKTFFCNSQCQILFNIKTSKHVDNSVIMKWFFCVVFTHKYLKNNENLFVILLIMINSVHFVKNIFFLKNLVLVSNWFSKIFMTSLLDLVQTHFYLFFSKEVIIALKISIFMIEFIYFGIAIYILYIQILKLGQVTYFWNRIYVFDFFIVGYLSKKNEDIYTTVDAILQQNTNFIIRFSNLDVEKAFESDRENWQP